MERLPALKAALAVLAGVLLQTWLNWTWLPWILLLLIPLGLARTSYGRSVGLLSALLVIGALRFLQSAEPDRQYPFAREAALFDGLVVEQTTGLDYTEFLIAPDSIAGEYGRVCRPPLVLVKTPWSEQSVHRGDRVRVRGIVRNINRPRHPLEPDWRRADRLRGVQGIVTVERPMLRFFPVEQSWSVLRFVDGLRLYLLDAAARRFPEQSRGLVGGMVLGQRQYLDRELKAMFQETGMAHLLAVSGLHVGFFVGLFGLLVSFVRLPPKYRLLFVIPAVTLYVILTGARPSVVRAAVMACLALTGMELQQRVEPMNTLGAAALCMMLWDPADVFDIGFQLSFAAFAGLGAAALLVRRAQPKFREQVLVLESLKRRRLVQWTHRWITVPVIYSCAVVGCTAPVTGYYFGAVPLAAVALNIVMIPLAGLFVGVAWLALLGGIIFELFGQWIAMTTEMLAIGLTILVEWGRAGGFSIPVSHWQILGVAATLAGGWYCLLGSRQQLRFRVCLCLLVLLNGWMWRDALQSRGNLEAIFFDVGQGDATLLTLPDQRHWLVDTGPGYSGAIIADYLNRAGIQTLDMLVITHPESDHLGGITTALDGIRILRACDGATPYTTETARRVRKWLTELQIPLAPVTLGSPTGRGKGYRIYALGPSPGLRTSNDRSVVLLVMLGDIRILLTGDVQKPAEVQLQRYGADLKSAVVKAPHHGSRFSSTPDFLKLASPDFTIFSAGRNNSFGHPTDEAMQRYRELGSRILRTDQQGAIVIQTDGETLRGNW
jgi:competence protein ComEC